MGELHDAEATMYGDVILSRIRSADTSFKQIFTPSIIRTGDWDWPRPDYVCYDEGLKASYALEFKPPFQSKREYLTGLGQTLSYLQKHMYSGLILPYYSDDGFRIAEFINDTLKSSEFCQISTSLFAYRNDSKEINILRPISSLRTDTVLGISADEVKTFWCWWRDISQYELYDLLNLSFKYADFDNDIYTNNVYPEFYEMMVNKKTRQWDGKTPRNKNRSEASMKSEKQNYKIPLVQLELWTRDEGRLTDSGFRLLEIGKKYGAGSARFLDALTYLVLINGRHLDLINMVDKFQKSVTAPTSSSEYAVDLENFLSDNGCIGKRKPTAIKTGAKNSYMRDEMKLWNKLGLLLSYNNKSYFYPNQGYVFNWERITNVILTHPDI